VSASDLGDVDFRDEGTAALPEQNLRKSMLTGVAWKLLGHGFAQVMRSVVGIVLARLLAPSDFGLAAIALVYIGVTGIFTDLALGAALVQRRVVTEEDRSTAFWTTLGVGTLLTLLGVALSPLIADALSAPNARPLIAATSSMVFLSSLGLTQTAILTRELRFRSLELRNFVGTIFGAAVALPVALAGFGAWAIVSQALASTAISSLLVWRLSPWRPKLVYSTESFRSLGSFGGKTVVAQFLGFLSLYADNILIARFLGTTALGIYSMAYNVMFVPVMRVAQPIQDVVFAGFAKLQAEPERLRDAWLRGTVLVSSLNAAAFLGMVVVAPDFVLVVLGAKWAPAVRVLQLLSLAGVAQAFMTLNWSTMQAIGRAGTSLRLRLFSVPLIIAAFAGGLHWGVEGVAGLYAAARAIVVVVSLVVTARALGAALPHVAARLARVLTQCLAMGAVVFAGRRALLHVTLDPGPRLAICVVLGIVVYLGIVRWRDPELLGEIRRLIPRRKSADNA
jgi:PST family polysaccharide transporter